MNANPYMLPMRTTGNDDLIPLSNLDAEEVEALLDEFVADFCTKAQVNFVGEISVIEEDFNVFGE